MYLKKNEKKIESDLLTQSQKKRYTEKKIVYFTTSGVTIVLENRYSALETKIWKHK